MSSYSLQKQLYIISASVIGMVFISGLAIWKQIPN